jgi:hypothetical protein
VSAHAVETVLVPAGAVWRYLDDGSDPGPAWRATGYDDSLWTSGPAELGYGDGDEATVVGYGPDPQNKYVTTYFRLSFEVADPGAFASLALGVLRDDGAVVHLNGIEVFRTNMPQGAVTAQTHAVNAIEDGNTFHPRFLPAGLLVAGVNTLAVEVHQVSPTSSDVSFDLELEAGDEPYVHQVTRGPYLQRGTPGGMVVRWRTEFPADSVLRYGLAPGLLDAVVESPALTVEHEVEVSGLAADTTYYYAIATSTGTLAGGDAEHRFVTSPVPGTRRAVRAWAIGDSGTGNASARAVRDAYLGHPGSAATDVWLMLGDNAYPDGTDPEYQAAVFDTYPTLLRNTVLWPAFGNHDAASASSATQSGPYYEVFTLPRLGEAGGVATGTEAYYSFDYANVHFVCLDSEGSDPSPTGAMATWLAADLAATDQDWVVAFWHHAPYSRGSHDSDFDPPMIDMREDVLPVLEAGGVDLVLAGHSHSYERSFLVDGHYGPSGTLAPGMIVDGGDGDPAGDGSYEKPVLGPAPHLGAVYAVAGNAGSAQGGQLNHPVMSVSLNTLGSVVLDVDANQLDGRFLSSTGAVLDTFRLVKPIPGAPACSDGVDTDRDGLTDLADPGCKTPAWPVEDPACQDGADNDGDGKIDFDGGVSIHGPGSPLLTAPDPECVGKPWRRLEPWSGCGLGFELALLLPALARLAGPRTRAGSRPSGRARRGGNPRAPC